MIKRDSGNIVIEEFLKIRGEEIRVKFPEPLNQPKEVEYIMLVMQGRMAILVAELVLSFNSRWN